MSEDQSQSNPPIGRNLRAMFCSGIFGCALFHDLLKPAAILCRVLQDDEVCIVRAIERHLVDLRIILITSLVPRPSITANAVESLVKL